MTLPSFAAFRDSGQKELGIREEDANADVRSVEGEDG